MRPFSVALGLGVGLFVGAYAVRRLERARRSVAPAHLAGQAGRAAGTFSERLRHAAEEGRQAAAAREAELRARYRVPDLQQAASAAQAAAAPAGHGAGPAGPQNPA